MDPPPSNDNPLGAVSLTVGTNFADQAIASDNVGATASEAADPSIPAPGCAAYNGSDVWYSVVVPPAGNVTIETDAQSGSPLNDTGLAIYSGPIGAFVLEACNDDSGNGLFSRIDLTGRTPGELLYIRVWEFGGGTEGPFQISAWNPLSNDDPLGAIALTVGMDFAANAVAGDNSFATSSEATDPSILAPGCANYLGGDLWYSVMVPPSGNVNIETNSDGSSVTDTGLAVYSGAIGALAFEECDDDDSADGLFSLISLTGRTPGEILYIRVWEYGNNSFGTFQISAWDPGVLSADAIQTEGFTYHPNPVRDNLNLNAPDPMSNVMVYNISGQEVMSVTPNETQVPLRMSGRPSGVYFVRVIIAGKVNTFKILKE